MRLQVGKHLKLAAVLSAVSVLLVVVTAVGISVMGDVSANRMTDSLISQRGRITIAGIRQRLADAERSKEIFAQLLAAEPEVVDAVAGLDPGAAAKQLIPLRARLGLEEVRVFDISGHELLHLGSVDDLHGIDDLLKSSKAGITTSRIDTTDHGLLVQAAAPVKDANGIVGTLIVGRLFAADSFADLTNGGNVELALFHDDRLVAMSTGDDSIARYLAEWTATSSGEAVIPGSTYSPIAAPLEDGGKLVALIDIRDVIAARQQRQRIQLLGTILISAIAAAIGVKLARMVTRPLSTMIGVASTIGQGRYDQRVPTSGIGELNTVATTINQLATDMEDRVTELTHQAGVLRDLDTRIRSTFDSATIGMALLTDSGAFLTTNPALSQTLDYSEAALAGMTLADVTHPDEVEETLTGLRQLLAGETEVVRRTGRYVDADRHTIWITLGMVAVRDNDGTFRYFVADFADVTALHRAETALTASEQRWRLTFEGAAAGIALIDEKDGRFLQVNQTLSDILGYERSHLTAKTVRDIVHPDDLERTLNSFERVARAEIPSWRSRARLLRRDGSSAHTGLSIALLRDPEGRSLQIVAHIVDISEQVAAEQQLARLLATKDQLIASVSHELRTPLTAIVGYSQVLNDRTFSLSTAEQSEMIDSIATEAADLAGIVEDLLVAARAESGHLAILHESVDLHAQTIRALELATHTNSGKTFNLHGPAVQAWGDPGRIRQIVRNLLSNAVRYGGDDIEITTEQLDSHVRLVVSDDGAGIPPAKREAIFEPYVRAHDRTGLTASVGLGLTVSRQLARLMDGDLTYRYTDGHSHFELSLPEHGDPSHRHPPPEHKTAQLAAMSRPSSPLPGTRPRQAITP